MAFALSKGRWIPYPYLLILSRWLVDLAMGRRKRIIVSMPPRHGKSELISRWFPAWFLEHFPQKRVVLCSYGAALAARHGRWVRNAIQGYASSLSVRVRDDHGAANDWETTEGGGMISAGVGGPITGSGMDIGIIDDPIKNRKEADSDTIREAIKEWYTSTFFTRLEPGAGIVILMTRWHEDDLAGWLQAEMKKDGEQFDILCLPAIAEEDDQMEREVGEPLCPWRYAADVLENIKRTVGSRDWWALYMQKPSPAEGTILKRQFWRRYAAGALPLKFDRIILSLDCSFKNTKESSFVALQVWAQLGPHVYLLHQVHERMGFSATVSAVRAVCTQFRIGAKVVEDKANGPAVIDMLKREIPGFVECEPYGDKVSRAWAIQHYLEGGNAWIPDDGTTGWVGDFVEECAKFPNATNNDQVDACTQAINYFLGHGHGSFKDVAKMQESLPRSYVDKATLRAFS